MTFYVFTKPKTRGGGGGGRLGEFETIMQTRDVVEGLHNPLTVRKE